MPGKKPTVSSDPLNIANEMRQFDVKNRDFYDSLDEKQKKDFSGYLMIRWGSTVSGSRDMQEFYVQATNQRLNRWFFAIKQQHAKLRWLLATTVSPDLGVQKHQWIAPKPRGKTNKMRKRMQELYPDYSDDEIDLMCKINSEQDLAQYEKDLGQT